MSAWTTTPHKLKKVLVLIKSFICASNIFIEKAHYLFAVWKMSLPEHDAHHDTWALG
jgi:hypothetical protein